MSWSDDVHDDAFRHKLAGEGLAVAAIHVCATGRLDHDSVRKALEVTDVTFYPWKRGNGPFSATLASPSCASP